MEDKEKCNCNEECTCDNTCNCQEEMECDNKECNCTEKAKDHKKEKKDKNKYKEVIEEMTKLNKKLEEQALREKAELINYRKRKDEEVMKMLKYSNEDIVMEILPTLDNFERAIMLDDANLTDELSKFLAGFKMIYGNLKTVLDKFGVKEIESMDKEFDPTYHQAVLTDHIEGVEPGMIIDVLQKGYLLKDKVIRPAMVKVSE